MGVSENIDAVQSAAPSNITQELLELLGPHTSSDIPTPMGQCCISRDGDEVTVQRMPLVQGSSERRMSIRLAADGSIKAFVVNDQETSLNAIPTLWPRFDLTILAATFRAKEALWLRLANKAS